MTDTAVFPCSHPQSDPLSDGCVRCGMAPYASVAAPLRARYRALLTRLAADALASASPIDLDTAALVIAALSGRMSAPEPPADDAPVEVAVTRPEVARVIQGELRNILSLHRATGPDDLMQRVWCVIHALYRTDSVTAESDPVEVALEPLQCYGGLGDDGEPRPDGVDVEFPCQCFVAYDPSLAEGMAVLKLNHEWSIPARMLARSADPRHSEFEPLFAWVRRRRAEGWSAPVEDLVLFAVVPADRWTPQLFVYRHTDDDPNRLVFIDTSGNCFAPRRDGRRKLGFRWEPISDGGAMHQIGIERFGYDERQARRRFDDDIDNEPFLAALVTDPWPAAT